MPVGIEMGSALVRVQHKRLQAVAMTALCGLGLAGCGGGDPTFMVGNLLAFNKTSVPAAPALASSKAKVNLTCPEVSIPGEGGTVRVFNGAGEASTNVRYQFGIRETARECAPTDNGQMTLKVGVSGRLLIGPAGTSGSYTTPVRIAVKREGVDGFAATQIVQASATLGPGETGADFTLVADNLTVPLIHEEANLDYTIVVGFDSGAREKPVAKPKRHR